MRVTWSEKDDFKIVGEFSFETEVAKNAFKAWIDSLEHEQDAVIESSLAEEMAGLETIDSASVRASIRVRVRHEFKDASQNFLDHKVKIAQLKIQLKYTARKDLIEKLNNKLDAVDEKLDKVIKNGGDGGVSESEIAEEINELEKAVNREC